MLRAVRMVEHSLRAVGLRTKTLSGLPDTAVDKTEEDGKLRERARGRWFESIHLDHFSNEMVMYKNKKIHD
ncbi:MAG: hypothetical protein UW27_C0011G0022 [Parcubacteria group bacterium GW2011_GWA1_44_13]|nr:MAG: hypothetical protein UW27_C0011G0022 [Parcubacteria group bacterium GW2011_GWA1_44_13]